MSLVEGQPLAHAARFASAAAAIAVTRLGAQPSIPTRGEIDTFLKDQLIEGAFHDATHHPPPDVRGTALTGAGVWLAGNSGNAAARLAPSEKLNIAFVGAGGQAAFSLEQLAEHNIVALC